VLFRENLVSHDNLRVRIPWGWIIFHLKKNEQALEYAGLFPKLAVVISQFHVQNAANPDEAWQGFLQGEGVSLLRISNDRGPFEVSVRAIARGVNELLLNVVP